MSLHKQCCNLYQSFNSDWKANINKNKNLFICFILLSLPIFFTFVFQNITIQSNYVGESHAIGHQVLGKGIYFNANAFLQYSLPALPISQCLIFYFAVFLFPDLVRRKVLIIATIIAFPSLLLVYLYGESITIPVKVFIQTMNFLISIEIFKKLIPDNFKKSDLISIIYSSLLLVCGIKFISDILFSWQLISTWFVFRNIQIYNFYGYFPIVYLLLLYFSYGTIKYQKYRVSKIVAIFALIISIICVLITWSRIYQALLIFSPLIFISKRFDSRVEDRVFNLFTIGLICFSGFYLYMMYSSHDLFASMQNQRSLVTRSSIIRIFFDNLEWKNIIFPSISEARNIFSLKGRNFHSEHIEIYSCLGLPFVIFFYGYLSKQIKKIFRVDRYMGIFFISILFLGGAVQLNLLQSYSGILLGALLGSFLKIYDNSQTLKKR